MVIGDLTSSISDSVETSTVCTLNVTGLENTTCVTVSPMILYSTAIEGIFISDES